MWRFFIGWILADCELRGCMRRMMSFKERDDLETSFVHSFARNGTSEWMEGVRRTGRLGLDGTGKVALGECGAAAEMRNELGPCQGSHFPYKRCQRDVYAAEAESQGRRHPKVSRISCYERWLVGPSVLAPLSVVFLLRKRMASSRPRSK